MGQISSECEITRMLVGAALPPGAEYGPENFAGDPLVKLFVDRICHGHGLKLETWVTWGALPEVSVLRNVTGNILVRSERFDTLLIEYFNLQRTLHHPRFTGKMASLVQSAVAKWFAEFLLGLRQPHLALPVFERHIASEHMFPNHTFRDETLASVPDLERAALQCFCLAHEIAHIVNPPRRGIGVDFEYDGMSLRNHLTWEFHQIGLDYDVQTELVARMTQQMDFDVLATEIDADISALGTIALFLSQVFGVSRAEAMKASLTALQAQSFLNHCRNSCRLLQRHVHKGLDPVEFGWLDWIEGQNVQARARVALRRAGVLLFMWDKKDGVTRNPDEYRIEVDTMLTGIQDFIGTLDQAAFDETKRLYETANTVRTDKSPESLNREIIRVLSKSNARTALFSILVAMGHSGGILLDLDSFLHWLARVGND